MIQEFYIKSEYRADFGRKKYIEKTGKSEKKILCEKFLKKKLTK